MWSTVAIGFKLGLAVMSPLQLLLAGTIISASIFAVITAVSRSWQVDARSLREAVAFGLINPCLYYLVLFEAYARLPPQIAQPLNYTWAIALACWQYPYSSNRSRRAGTYQRRALGRILANECTGEWQSVQPHGLEFSRRHTDVGCHVRRWTGVTDPRPANLHLRILGRRDRNGHYLSALMRLTRHAAHIGQLILFAPFLSLVLISTVIGEHIRLTSVLGLLIIVAGTVITDLPTNSDPKHISGH
jgi:hypothetical protein